MRFAVEINHPKHYYQFKYLIKLIRDNDHEVIIIAKDKEIVFKILEEEKAEYIVIGKHYNKLLFKAFGTLRNLVVMNGFVRKYKPNVILSKASLISCLFSRIYNFTSIIFPDSEVVPLTNRLVSKLAVGIITPKYFSLNFGEKHHRVNGFFEETYLAKEYFTPNKQIGDILATEGKPYAILRFVSWNANHDIGKSVISIKVIDKIIDLLGGKYNIYITSEAKLPEKFHKYFLPIPKNEIHSALFFASLYIGDSQSMATESALLGTPAIRCNKFVGENDMNIFKVLENDLKILFNFSDWDQALQKIEEVSNDKELKISIRQRADGYYEKKQDINNEIYSIIKTICYR